MNSHRKKVEISVILAAKNEGQTIEKSLSKLSQALLLCKRSYEILIVISDKETYELAQKVSKDIPELYLLEDRGESKSDAVNKALKVAKGKYCIFTDADVYVNKSSLNYLISSIEESDKIGLVSAKVKSINDRETKLGFWAYLLTKMAHLERKDASKQNRLFPSSGYLYTTRRSVTPKLPKKILVDDHYITSYIHSRNFDIIYQPKAIANFRAPEHMNDYFKQKVRTLAGNRQILQYFPSQEKGRSFIQEMKGGLKYIFRFIYEEDHFFWTVELYIVRLIVWIYAYIQFNLKYKRPLDLWKEVKSTKKI